MINLRIKLFLLLGAMALAVSCTQESVPVPSGPVSLKARIADETRATLSEDNGTFAFSSTDAIKVYNGIDVYESDEVTLEGSTASFTMQQGFTDTGSGFAAYPAAIVTGITSEGVTFTLPTTYTYEQVGGTDASTSQVPCPMIATYTAGQELEFKQAGAVIRFRVKECLAGTLTFTFKSQVTGTVTLSSVPSGANDGILTNNLTDIGYSITVTGVPAVTGDDYFFVTLPVPVGTDPMNVSVWNDGSTAGRFATLSDNSGSLERAKGYKRGVTLQERAVSMTFGGFSIAGFLYNYNDDSYGILTAPLEVLERYGVNDDKQYYFCWNDIINHIPRLFTANGLTIGDHRYSVPTGGPYGQWKTIVGTDRAGATVNSTPAHYAFVTVTGLNTQVYPASSIRGLLLFPDKATIDVPSTLTAFDSDSETDGNVITVGELGTLEEKGCVFLPTTGYSESKNNVDTWGGLNTGGYFWSRTNFSSDYAYALSITYSSNQYSISPTNAADSKATAYFPICLIQCD